MSGPSSLTLEVVPAGPGAGAQLDAEVLENLARLGVRLSLDDGGRAASFAALRVLPLDELKIDGAFVHGIGRSATDAALVRGMIDIGHALGLQVVAEGVESREAWKALGQWGCDYAQGFYVAGPSPATGAHGVALRELARKSPSARRSPSRASRAAPDGRRVRSPRARG